jgi:hypothetical protein
MGVIQQQILEAIHDVEKENNQLFFNKYLWKQDCLMGNIFDAGLSTDKVWESGMTG